MKQLNWLPLVLLLAQPLEAQEVSDTILVTIQGNVTDVVLATEYVTTPFRVGDTVLFRAVVTDETGDPINAFIQFFAEDPSVIRLVPITDPTMALNEGQAYGVALMKTTGTRVWVRATPIGGLQIASFRDGALNWTLNDTIGPGETLQYCAYLHDLNFNIVAQGPLPPDCPIIQRTGSVPLSFLASSDISRWSRLRRN